MPGDVDVPSEEELYENGLAGSLSRPAKLSAISKVMKMTHRWARPNLKQRTNRIIV